MIFAALSSAVPLSALYQVASAASIPGDKTFIRGKVTLNSLEGFPDDTSSSALYITARPIRPDNVPKAILDGSNGKPPPVLAARVSNPSFPFDFQLTGADLTIEGVSSSSRETDQYWFGGQDLVISARWDTDGVAATREATDLVGRTQYFASKDHDIEVALTGRGFTGKLVTGKSKK
eukprot:CAMPEP_0197238406 /NCGR_PEP_ID=MMETSP1429-20130617/4873_1 /TAXON_ID=49237 /ORGANISM="Chaetoceros  sp., Strain UNC1202" /LENGTH=176 /DNA_ID=CAMNT_0042697541 /DNA_START=232 /DNA_END=762 /DNA_ORIENTATION=+